MLQLSLVLVLVRDRHPGGVNQKMAEMPAALDFTLCIGQMLLNDFCVLSRLIYVKHL